MPCGYELLKVALIGEVDFVDEQEDGYVELLYLLDELGIFVGLFHHIGNVKQHIGVLKRTFGEGEHRLLEFVVGLEHTGGVGEHNLRIVGVDDAHDAVACGLRFESGDGDAFAHEKIHER